MISLKHPIFKVCLFGEEGVGKTSMMFRILGNEYREFSYFYPKAVELEGRKFTLMLWFYSPIPFRSTPEKQKAWEETYFKGASGGIFVYDITNRKSLKNFDSWMGRFKENQEGEHAPILVVGNKLDLEDKRAISEEEALELVKKCHAFKSLECSSKTRENVEEMIMTLSKEIMRVYLLFEEEMDTLIREKKSLIIDKFMDFLNKKDLLAQEQRYFNSLNIEKKRFFKDELEKWETTQTFQKKMKKYFKTLKKH